MRNIRKWAIGGAVLAMGMGLIGTGVRESYTDTGSATVGVSVGTFGCTVTSSDPNAVVSGHSVTINLPEIDASTASYRYVQDVTVNNTGSMPEVVHWTFTTGGTLTASQWQPTGLMGYTTGTTGNNMTTDIVLAGGASHTYGAGGNGVGFIWATLDDTYLGQTASVTYTANCGEQPASGISFVGAADAAITTGTAIKASSVACPTGSPAAGYYPWVSSNTAQWCGNNTFPVSASLASWPASGSFTVAASGGTATVTYTGRTTTSPYEFTGLTNTSSATGSVAPGSNNVVQVLAATALPLPSGWQPGDVALALNYGASAAVVTNFTGIMSAFGNYGPSKLGYKVLAAGDQNITIAANKGVGIAVVVYRGVAGIGSSTWAGDPGSVGLAVPGLTLTKTGGSSWVVGLFASASVNVSGLSFSGLTTRGPFTGTRAGVLDTNKGVSTWAGMTGGPLATGDEYAVELESS